MEEYRAYVIGPDGHIINRVDVRCFDEKEARRLAKIAVDGHAVGLWQGRLSCLAFSNVAC